MMAGIEEEIGVEGKRTGLAEGLWIGVGRIGGWVVGGARLAFGRGMPSGGNLLRAGRRHLGRRRVVVVGTAAGTAGVELDG